MQNNPEAHGKYTHSAIILIATRLSQFAPTYSRPKHHCCNSYFGIAHIQTKVQFPQTFRTLKQKKARRPNLAGRALGSTINQRFTPSGLALWRTRSNNAREATDWLIKFLRPTYHKYLSCTDSRLPTEGLSPESTSRRSASEPPSVFQIRVLNAIRTVNC